MAKRLTGVIIRLLPNRGYGFVRGSEDGLTRFMHASEAEEFDRFHEGLKVTFISRKDPEGSGNKLRAVEVERCS